MSSEPVKENLQRVIGTRSLVLAILNITVGTGIFVIPALIAEKMGASAIVAYLVCGGLIFLIALCFAELGSNTNISGGTYTYIENAFGPFAGFMANNIYWFGACVFSDGAIANALADTLGYFFPVFTNALFRAGFFVLVFGGLAFLNIRSVKRGLRLVELTAIGKLFPLILLVVISGIHISPGNLLWKDGFSFSELGTSSLLLFFAFMGMETPLSNGGEIADPQKTVPKALFIAVLLLLLLYIGIQVVTQGVLGDAIQQHKEAPLAAVAARSIGKTGGVLIILITAVSMFGALGSEILSIPRILYSGARDGLLPGPLAKIDRKYLTPAVAIFVYALIDCVLSIAGEFKTMATIASASSLIIYMGVVLATIKMRKKDPGGSKTGFRIPGGYTIPVLASIVILWLLNGLEREDLKASLIFVGVVALIYPLMVFLKRRKGQHDPS